MQLQHCFYSFDLIQSNLIELKYENKILISITFKEILRNIENGTSEAH